MATFLVSQAQQNFEPKKEVAVPKCANSIRLMSCATLVYLAGVCWSRLAAISFASKANSLSTQFAPTSNQVSPSQSYGHSRSAWRLFRQGCKLNLWYFWVATEVPWRILSRCSLIWPSTATAQSRVLTWIENAFTSRNEVDLSVSQPAFRVERFHSVAVKTKNDWQRSTPWFCLRQVVSLFHTAISKAWSANFLCQESPSILNLKQIHDWSPFGWSYLEKATAGFHCIFATCKLAPAVCKFASRVARRFLPLACPKSANCIAPSVTHTFASSFRTCTSIFRLRAPLLCSQLPLSHARLPNSLASDFLAARWRK